MSSPVVTPLNTGHAMNYRSYTESVKVPQHTRKKEKQQ